MKDLALLVADKNMDFAMRGILARPEALGIRPVEYEIKPHPGRDGGARTTGPEILSLLRSQFHHGILMLDWEGSGAGTGTAMDLEAELDRRLTAFWGQEGQAKAIVIEPEVDAWVWGSDNVLRELLGWSERKPIRAWLRGRGYDFGANQKPVRPKEALEDLMVTVDQPRSSDLYLKATGRISLHKCSDPAFQRLRDTLRSWFSTV
jgi:hypothetical protein